MGQREFVGGPLDPEMTFEDGRIPSPPTLGAFGKYMTKRQLNGRGELAGMEV